MNDTSTLIVALAAQQLLFACGWWMQARNIAAQRKALLHWSVFCALTGLSLLLFGEAARRAAPELAQVLRNVALVAGAMALRRGLLQFSHQPLRDREQMLVFAVYMAALALLGTSDDAAARRTIVIAIVMCWLPLRMAYELYRGARSEFGAPAVACVGAPLAAVGVAMGVRGVLAIVRPDAAAASITVAAGFNVALLLTVAVVLAVFHFALNVLVARRMVAELEHLSSHDSLTQLLNRRAFEQRLTGEIAAGIRAGAPLGLLLIDIDHFKRVNDRLGHQAGDAVLREVADRLAAAVRRSDVLARVGGEEFGVLLPDTDAPGIRQAAERLRLAVCGRPLDRPEGPLEVTVSVGASMRLSGESDAEAMLRRADQALYRAKAEGRDRTVFDTLAQVSEASAAPVVAPAIDAV